MSDTGESSKAVVVLGVGPIPPENPPRLHAPGLRLWTLARFLAGRGHDVAVAMVGFGGGQPESGPPGQQEDDALSAPLLPHGIKCYHLPYNIALAAKNVRRIAEQHRARCVVSTTDFMNLVAATARVAVPLWLDFMGQPMAERQLLADVCGSDEGLLGQWEYVVPSLLAGDRFSVCSERQRYMMLGELGAVGRLNRHTVNVNLVETLVPFHLFDEKIAHTRTVLRGSLVGANDFVVLWSGGYNTWADVETLFRGIEYAMARERRMVFVSTGGAIPGHDERTFEHFRRLVETSANRDRYKLCGWVPTDDVQNYYLESNVAVNVDRWTVEGLVGYRTRILDWIMAGLPVVTTALSELVEELASRGFVTTFRIGDPDDLGEKLLALARDCSEASERTAKARDYLQTRLDPAVALAPLAAWVESPQPAPDLPAPHERPNLPFVCPQNSLAQLHCAALRSHTTGSATAPAKKRWWERLLGC
ncbi:glycosyltransferase [Candidatus Sumerlaeota bacterium]|nr:glycosyltransferase [Candidatus Sumerlaeota bacterium]